MRRRLAGGFVMLLSLGVLIPSTVSAQDVAGYDAGSEATFKGTVTDVQVGRSALYWFSRIHTLGLGHMRAPDTQLLLKTDTEIVAIQLGPRAFLNESNVEIEEGDTLEVTGSRVTIGESHVVLARELRNGDNVWMLRDAAGRPLECRRHGSARVLDDEESPAHRRCRQSGAAFHRTASLRW